MRRLNLKTLQKKKWYRYLKIGYLTACIASFILVMHDASSILRPKLNEEGSYIQCDNGSTFFLGAEGMRLSGPSALSSADDKLARRLCISDEHVGALARSTVTNLPEEGLTDAELGQKIKTGQNFMYQNIYRLLTPEEKNYDVVEVYVKQSIFTILAWLIVPAIVLIIIFELELRIFYYVMLGKFLPEKPARYLFFKVRY